MQASSVEEVEELIFASTDEVNNEGPIAVQKIIQ